MSSRVLVLTGDGLNCESETASACEYVGLTAEIRHLNDLIAEEVDQNALIANYGAVIIPGGFSFGDEWGSGRILALKIQDQLRWDLREYARQGGWVLGICNGFQALIRLGVFGRNVSITHNESGQFIDRWVTLRVSDDRGWLGGGGAFDLPIRHGEGRIVVDGECPEPADVEVALQYGSDANGSWKRAAALVAEGGHILGMMPHPEAAVRQYHVPGWTKSQSTARDAGPGAWIFRNLKKHLEGRKT